MSITYLPQALKIALRWDQYAADTSYGFDYHSGNIAGAMQGNDAVLQFCRQIRPFRRQATTKSRARQVLGVAQMIHAWQHYAKRMTINRQAAEGCTGHVSAVKCTFSTDETLARAFASVAVKGHGYFQRRI